MEQLGWHSFPGPWARAAVLDSHGGRGREGRSGCASGWSVGWMDAWPASWLVQFALDGWAMVGLRVQVHSIQQRQGFGFAKDRGMDWGRGRGRGRDGVGASSIRKEGATLSALAWVLALHLLLLLLLQLHRSRTCSCSCSRPAGVRKERASQPASQPASLVAAPKHVYIRPAATSHNHASKPRRASSSFFIPSRSSAFFPLENCPSPAE